MNETPYILTLSLDEKATDYFNMLRVKHFPPERNFIKAHLTMFHALPGTPEMIAVSKAFCESQKKFVIKVVAPVSIGKGVAFKLESDALKSIHKSLQDKWWQFLSLQDRQKIWPHITIQNKVTLLESKQLLTEMEKDFIPFEMEATGMSIWEYLNGPWKFVSNFPFRN